MAGTTRQNKFNRLIQKELSEIFQRDKKGILDNTFISVGDVRISTDLSIAKVYISMMLGQASASAAAAAAGSGACGC
jgi:ribosome-binding factor A